MTAMFKKQKLPEPVEVPEPESPAEMPDPENIRLRNDRTSSLLRKRQARGGGRQATILSRLG